jgi:hypothetical protein
MPEFEFLSLPELEKNISELLVRVKTKHEQTSELNGKRLEQYNEANRLLTRLNKMTEKGTHEAIPENNFSIIFNEEQKAKAITGAMLKIKKQIKEVEYDKDPTTFTGLKNRLFGLIVNNEPENSVFYLGIDEAIGITSDKVDPNNPDVIIEGNKLDVQSEKEALALHNRFIAMIRQVESFKQSQLKHIEPEKKNEKKKFFNTLNEDSINPAHLLPSKKMQDIANNVKTPVKERKIAQAEVAKYASQADLTRYLRDAKSKSSYNLMQNSLKVKLNITDENEENKIQQALEEITDRNLLKEVIDHHALKHVETRANQPILGKVRDLNKKEKTFFARNNQIADYIISERRHQKAMQKIIKLDRKIADINHKMTLPYFDSRLDALERLNLRYTEKRDKSVKLIAELEPKLQANKRAYDMYVADIQAHSKSSRNWVGIPDPSVLATEFDLIRQSNIQSPPVVSKKKETDKSKNVMNTVSLTEVNTFDKSKLKHVNTKVHELKANVRKVSPEDKKAGAWKGLAEPSSDVFKVIEHDIVVEKNKLVDHTLEKHRSRMFFQNTVKTPIESFNKRKLKHVEPQVSSGGPTIKR